MTTVLAAFDQRLAADQALDQLAAAGVPREDLQLEHDLERLKGMNESRKIGNDSVLGSAGRMFADLVQTNVDYHHVDLATEAVERGGTVLVARLADSSQAGRIVALLRQLGAYDVVARTAPGTPR